MCTVSKSGRTLDLSSIVSCDSHSLYILHTHTVWCSHWCRLRPHWHLYLQLAGTVQQYWSCETRIQLEHKWWSFITAWLHCTLYTQVHVCLCVTMESRGVCLYVPSLLLWEEDRWWCSLQWPSPLLAAVTWCFVCRRAWWPFYCAEEDVRQIFNSFLNICTSIMCTCWKTVVVCVRGFKLVSTICVPHGDEGSDEVQHWLACLDNCSFSRKKL